MLLSSTSYKNMKFQYLALVVFIVQVARPAYALGPGEVCMFNAPSGTDYLGHVGWAYLVGGTSTWIYGATEEASESWHESGSFTDMLNAFRGAGTYHDAGYYKYYRCEKSPNSSVGAADQQVAKGEASGYNWDYDNCLTKSVAVFKAYDSGTFGGLDDGVSVLPNAYFENALTNF